ncbi:helix-turn-helix domain-containing protein [Streptomyces sp. ISL-98]|uniref:PucR family transcriptional regulator n=1 Tax=Streptomyces sp. ISL-98 TaxID=2819192 RepID=UPI001BECBEEE|nr:PucR family transcriptional regulator [Streptomyces sp. ISL-98]MBT2511486.1 helix-turn-helix domain-containing protein [Streptomyces sp. ISL-98]
MTDIRPVGPTDLFEALVSYPPPDETTVARLAHLAGWILPDTVQAIAVAPVDAAHRPLTIAPGILTGARGDVLCLLLPDPKGNTRLLRRGLEHHRVAVGPVVPRREAHHSHRWACRLLELTSANGHAGVVHVHDHLSGLLLLQDEFLLRTMAALHLRPLAGLTSRREAQLAETLLAWLEGRGVAAAAQALGLHPQTVRYRMRQIERLFGPTLQSPRTRFEIELALKGRRLLSAVHTGGLTARTGSR